ncbi:tRNA (N6-isopentenyl adenosine(37)-C2)-methylthiotransferase MiaB [Algibacter lectus]|uniref:tRNA-2-methylthio-N(6)-dimethylallyladenosine synthase n=1 Tax=Algibacter lectus TaxID=221126 RepID=A0A4R8MAK6_9FLAO|nr:tRNA (N6-isopentenyl adenosine(37)-C2)-methylthiotransferase MiaB [Algibacter lectus]MWW25978.1 tRNA (N6-isopentenyl adenosine(37)-C2)-methylthiotransferase MiaB [Algibacter lectus]TDY60706.1 tRNA-i(6)A37 thiotransferase enzyme MiaB [Algibacter lectus]
MEKIIDENKQGQSLTLEQKEGNTRKLFIESYGCSMNFSDSEIVASIMKDQGFNTTQNLEEADLVLVNTCSIRDKAEQTVRKRLEKYNAVKRDLNPKMKVGVLGCMAERLKTKFLEEEKIVDLVVGPDAYKDLPNLLAEVDEGRDAINVILSKEETYGDISPVRLNSNGVTAFVSITRGCDNMCTFCVVPFTRGRERSRDPQSILEEINDLWSRGFKEITLLGQNVDSYLWYGGGLKKDFVKATDMEKATAVDFAKLLELCAKEQPKMRIRFSTSNPQDLTLDVVETMAKFNNICNHIHLPVQSGSNRILKEMNRLHTREEYFELIDNIRRIIPKCTISHDMIVGFPTETEEDFQDTVSLMEYVKYNFGYMFTYSERPGTMAGRNMEDDVPEPVKKRRLQDIVDLQRQHSEFRTKEFLDTEVEVLIEKESKKSTEQWSGRTSQNIVCVFPKGDFKIGDFVKVKVNNCTSATLIGVGIALSMNN